MASTVSERIEAIIRHLLGPIAGSLLVALALLYALTRGRNQQQPSARSLGVSALKSGLPSTFPPSQRHKLVGGGSDADLSHKTCYRSPLGLEDDWRAADDTAYCSSSGFFVGEIRALGDLPDYAHLSDVPLPRAYPGFDIRTARPRPYRPLRWPYHQTMCEFLFLRVPIERMRDGNG